MLKIIQAFHLSVGFAENQIVFWDLKIPYSIRITEGSDNRGSTVVIRIIFANFELSIKQPNYIRKTIVNFLLCISSTMYHVCSALLLQGKSE